MPRHAHALEHPGWVRRGADGALHLEHVSVSRGSAAEVVPANYAREATPLAGAQNVNELFVIEQVDQHLVPDLHAIASGLLASRNGSVDNDRHLPQKLHRRQVVLRQMTFHGLRQPRFLDELDQPELGRFIAVARGRLQLRHDARTGLQYGHGTNLALAVEQLGHPDLFPKNSVQWHSLVLLIMPALPPLAL